MRSPAGRTGSGRGRSRWTARVVVGAAVVLGAMAGLAAPASAHATLESSNPPSGTAIARSPGKVTLRFDEQVSVSPTSIEVFNSAAKRVDAGGTRHVPNDSHSVETAIPPSLPAGGYVVTWRVVSADSHPVDGAFTFFIGTTTGAGTLNSEAGHLLAASSGSRTVGVVYGIMRFLGFCAVAGLLGGLLFATVIWPDALKERRTLLILWSSLALLLVATAGAFALQGVYGAGLGLADALKSNVLAAVWHTRFGKAHVARLVLVAIMGAQLVHLGRHRGRAASGWSIAGCAAVGVAMLSTWGVADHASTGTLVALTVPFDVVHLGAAAIWIGGLIMIVAVVLPAGRGERAGPASPLRTAVPRFSQWALGAVVAIVATGLFASWRQVGISWGALTTTPYGKLLLYKVGGLVVLVALASISRTAIHGRLALPGSRHAAATTGGGPTDVALATRLRTVVGAEIVVAIVVLALTALLVNARPAKDVYAAPFSAQVKAGPTIVNVVVDPAKAGPLTVHLYVLTADGLVDNVPEVDATMSNTGAGIAGLTIPLRPAGPGHYVVYGFNIPIPGTWTLRLTVRTDNIDEYFADPVTVHIR